MKIVDSTGKRLLKFLDGKNNSVRYETEEIR